MDRWEGIVNHLHVGTMVGKVKMLRNERMREESLFGFVVSWWWNWKEEMEFGEEPRRMRRLSERLSKSEARWFEGMILLLLLVVVVLVLVLLWRMRFCCCCFMLC